MFKLSSRQVWSVRKKVKIPKGMVFEVFPPRAAKALKKAVTYAWDSLILK